jgi:hypothetical protein
VLFRSHDVTRKTTAGLSLNQEKVIKELIGRLDAPTRDPLEQLFRIEEAIVREAAQNRAGAAFGEQALVHRAAFTPAEQAIIRPLKEGESVTAPDTGVISWFSAGKRQRLAVPRVWADEINFVAPNDILAGFQTLNRVRNLFQLMATGANLAFASRNVPRDIFDLVTLSKVSPNGRPRDIARTLRIWGQMFADEYRSSVLGAPYSEGAIRFRESGADYSTMTAHLAPSEGALGYHPVSPGARGLHAVRGLLNASEKATKRTAMALLEEAGLSGDALAWEVRTYGGSPDFAKMGFKSAQAKQIWMFFGPQVQGLDRMVRRYADEPQRLLYQAVGLSVAAAALNGYNTQYLNPETGLPELDMIPLSERRTNLIFILPFLQTTSSGQQRWAYARMPMGHAMQSLLTPVTELFASLRDTLSSPSLPQVAFDSAANLLPGSGTIDADRPLASAVQSFVLGLNPLLKVPIEELQNQNAFTGAPIVGRRVSQRLPAEQWTEKTSPFMVDLGRVTGLSPDRLEHVYRGLFPGPGEMLLSALDAPRRPELDRAGTEAVTSLPFIGPLVRSYLPSGGSEYRKKAGQDVFTEAERAQAVTATINDLLKTDPERARTTLEDPETASLYGRNRTLQGIARGIAALARERLRITYDTEMTPAEKSAALRDLWQQEIALLAEGGTVVHAN